MSAGVAPRDHVAALWRHFAERETVTRSPLYQELAARVAEDDALLDLLAALEPRQWQPNLLLGAVRYLVGTVAGWEQFREVVVGRREEVLAVMASHRTQTNEPARCATLLPVLASLPQPLALVEVGASARLPRLRAAIEVAQEVAPPVFRGDLRTDLPALAAEAPVDATLVVFHTATLAYVRDPAEREAFARTVGSVGAVWVANEGARTLPGISPEIAGERSDDSFLICLNGEPLAWADSHGVWVQWR